MATNLFQLGYFTLHSGKTSNFKIECDALTEGDWLALAKLIVSRCEVMPFKRVVGIPRGGLMLANMLQPYVTDTIDAVSLVVDDVWTTGGTMTPYLDDGYFGFVAFARKPILDHRAKALFTMEYDDAKNLSLRAD